MSKYVLKAAVFLGLLAAGCDDQSNKPFVKIAGGGFTFNYRYAIMNYGFVVKPLRPLPEGSTLEARFEIPGEVKKLVLTLPAVTGKMLYGFETPALQGVKKDVPYKATLRLLEKDTGKELAVLEQAFFSGTDQDALPSKAPVQGVGYFPVPQ